MPYPIDFCKQSGASESMGGKSQSRWNFSFENIKETVSDDTGGDPLDAEPSNDAQAPPVPPPEPTARPKKAQTPAERERELNYALVAAHRNLTRISQYVLKLEAYANIATKEDVRQTLEATLENSQHSSRDAKSTESSSEDGRHERLIEDVSRHSEHVWYRVYLLWGESSTKPWLERVLEANRVMDEEIIYYTVRDMAAGRPLAVWLGYIRDMCHRGDEPAREGRVVAIAWAFLDRGIRPSRPGHGTTVAQFIAEWDALRKRGAFNEALENPESQRGSDAEILASLKGLWSARMRPL
ncbi:hypothetical protein PG994_005575 [Apiospora phragmitis]|uniref:Uncharacterized protein n=1 Tax=Apiospora phragmitis TaxID=2905665 RepID=A0ABR1VG39_9PEZI